MLLHKYKDSERLWHWVALMQVRLAKKGAAKVPKLQVKLDDGYYGLGFRIVPTLNHPCILGV